MKAISSKKINKFEMLSAYPLNKSKNNYLIKSTVPFLFNTLPL